jgi:hypothetical protein
MQLFQHTPNLYVLDDRLDRHTPTKQLLNVLRRHCRKLKSIDCSDNIITDGYGMSEDDVVSWIETSSRLVSFGTKPETLTNRILPGFAPPCQKPQKCVSDVPRRLCRRHDQHEQPSRQLYQPQRRRYSALLGRRSDRKFGTEYSLVQALALPKT